jgi:hypothetical protein
MNISLIRATSLGFIVLSMAACSSMQSSGDSEGAADTSKAGFEKAYQAAEDAYNKAKEANNLWTTTDDELKAAKEAAAKGDMETATKLANRAKFESEAAYAQAESEKDARPWEF